MEKQNFWLAAAAEETRLEDRLLRKLQACNERTARYGLVLTETQTAMLVQARRHALQQAGRVEFTEGILPQLIYEFCDSPCLVPAQYAQTLQQLQELFYYFKTQSEERLSDEELLCAMRRLYDESGGSVDYLAGTGLELLCRALRAGEPVPGRKSTMWAQADDEDGEGADE